MRPLVGAALFFSAAALYLHDVDRPFGNSDEAIYAQMAVEMSESGQWTTLSWQGEPILNRPPLAVWPLAAAALVFGPSEETFRTVLALEAALAVLLLFLWCARRHGDWVGLVAALLLATADRYLRYARFIESEPMLLVLVLASAICWERGRRSPAFVGLWGACLAGTLLTKQLVGLFPLLFPLLDWATRRARVRPALLWRGLAVAAAGAMPWHLAHWAEHGQSFIDAFVGANVAWRFSEALHQSSSASFYVEMLWQREGPLILVSVVGVAYSVVKRDPLPSAWLLGALGPFSLSSSRYDYYALLAYPALCLAAARPTVELLRGVLAPVVVIGWGSLHLVSAYRAPIRPADAETGYLAARMRVVSRRADPLAVVDQHPYSARYYSRRHTIQIVFSKQELAQTRRILPADAVLGTSLVRTLARHRRWFAILPKVHLEKLRGIGIVYRVATTARYVLVTNVPRS